MRLNKIIVTGIAAAAVLAIAGCGSSSTGAASSAGETAPYAATEQTIPGWKKDREERDLLLRKQ